MALVERGFKWAIGGIVGLMFISAAGSAAVAGAASVVNDPVVIAVLLGAFLCFMGLLAVPMIAAGLYLWRWWRMTAISEQQAAEFIAPDEHGRLPVPASLLRSSEFANRAIDSHQASYLSNLTTFHYSPEQNITGADGPTMAAAATTAPGSFWQLYQAGALPNRGFLMGYTLDGDEPVTADWQELYSSLIGGQSGAGKSTLIRSILAQSALQGGRFVVVDPHYSAGGDSLGASLAPLHGLMLCDVASNDQQIADALNYVGAIGRRRLQGADKERWPLVLVIDETTALFQRSNVAGALATTLGQISQETRKVGVYAMCIGQNFDGRIMDTTVRNSFVSMITMRARRDVARVQSGSTEFGKMAETLTIGQCVWMAPSGEMHKLAVPNCTAGDLELVAHSFEGKNTYSAPQPALQVVGAVPSAVPMAIPSAVPDDLSATYLERHFPKAGTADGTATAGANERLAELVNDDRAARAVAMFLQGKSNGEIAAEIWGATTGNKKVKALQELNDILRAYMLSLKGGTNER